MPDRAARTARPTPTRPRATRARRDRSETPPGPPWTFLTNHSHVLVCLLQDPGARLRDVADRIGITERAVQKIVLDLERARVLRREREGRRNRYSLFLDVHLRHPVEAHSTLRELLAPILRASGGGG